MSFASNNSQSSIPIPNPKPSKDSWFAAQLLCYTNPLNELFNVIASMNTKSAEEQYSIINSELQNKNSKLSKTLQNLYTVIRSECIIQENVVRVLYHEQNLIDKLEYLTNILFDYNQIINNSVRNRKNPLYRIDMLDILTELLIYIYNKKDIFLKFINRTFSSNDDIIFNNENANYNSSNNSQGSFGNFEGGYQTKRNKRYRKNKIYKKRKPNYS